MGKAMLAHLPPAELESYLRDVQLEPRTEQTITSVERLRAELATVRQQGYALSEGEHRPGVRSIAAPVRAYGGDVVAAVCVRHYLPPDVPPDPALIRAVTETAMQVSHHLGFGAEPR
jgi:DNA-binding IclR family transcriptional regulator